MLRVFFLFLNWTYISHILSCRFDSSVASIFISDNSDNTFSNKWILRNQFLLVRREVSKLRLFFFAGERRVVKDALDVCRQDSANVA